MLEAMRAGHPRVRGRAAEPGGPRGGHRPRGRPSARSTASVFAFIGAKGGVGTTTAAVNVAMELSRVAPKQTLLMDLHMSNGDAGLFLGEEPRFSVADAIENAHRLDEAFLRSLVVRTKGHLDLLASPEFAGRSLARADAGESARCVRVRLPPLPLHRARRAALGARSARGARPRRIGSWSWPTRNWPPCRSASRMAASFRQRYGKERVAVAVSRYDSDGRDRPGRHRTRGRHEGRARAAVRLPARRRGAQQRPPAEPRQPQPCWPGRSARWRATWPACRPPKKPPKSTGGFLGLSQRTPELTAGPWRSPPSPAQTVDSRHPQYQEIKARVHQGLLNRLNLERLTRTRREEAEPEIRGLVADMLDAESGAHPAEPVRAPGADRRRPQRVVRPGAARVAAGRPVDLRHPGEPVRPGLRRAQRPARAGGRRVQGRRAPDADHRADRQFGRPPDRRIEPDGGRPAGGRLARQRDHPAAGARRPGALHPPLPDRQAGAARTSSIASRSRSRCSTSCRRRWPAG